MSFLSCFAILGHFVVAIAHDDSCDASLLQLQEKLDRSQLNFSDSPYILHFRKAETAGQKKTSQAELPIVMMHGMGDYGSNPAGMVPMQNMLAGIANTYVHSVELCSNPDQLSHCSDDDQQNGFFMTMEKQVDQFARVVRADSELHRGFNALGFSQGNTVIRGYIHKYNDPPVNTFLSIHGVLMGVNGVPDCPLTSGLCRLLTSIISHVGIYSSFVQDHLAQANYFRDAANLKAYRASCHFLPFINNEIQGPGNQNSVHKSNFESLQKLVLVMAQNVSMVHPKESEHFGYFKDGSRTELVTMRDAPWYKDDWFGLKSLDEAKKIDFYSTPGDHLRFSKEFLHELVARYFASNKPP